MNVTIDPVDVFTHENFVGNIRRHVPDSISLKQRKIDVRDVFRRWPDLISVVAFSVAIFSLLFSFSGLLVSSSDVNVSTTRPRVHNFKEKLWEVRYTWSIRDLQGPHSVLFDVWFIFLVDVNVSTTRPRVHNFKEKLWEVRYTWSIRDLQGPHSVLFDVRSVFLV